MIDRLSFVVKLKAFYFYKVVCLKIVLRDDWLIRIFAAFIVAGQV